MLNDNEAASLAQVEEENRRLRASLRKCEALVADCRAKLHNVQEDDGREARTKNGSR